MKRILGIIFIALFTFSCARIISDLVLKIGNGTDVDVAIEAELGKGASNPYINYNTTSDEWEVCNEGSACVAIGSGGGIPLLAKGSLLTSDGVANGEFTACADNEIIVWDSAETAGFKCAALPSGGGLSALPYNLVSDASFENSSATGVCGGANCTITYGSTNLVFSNADNSQYMTFVDALTGGFSYSQLNTISADMGGEKGLVVVYARTIHLAAFVELYNGGAYGVVDGVDRFQIPNDGNWHRIVIPFTISGTTIGYRIATQGGALTDPIDVDLTYVGVQPEGFLTDSQASAIATNTSDIATNTSAIALNTAKVSADGSIATHSDVDLTGINSGDVLEWNGSSFVAATPSGGGGASFNVVKTALGTSSSTSTTWVTRSSQSITATGLVMLSMYGNASTEEGVYVGGATATSCGIRIVRGSTVITQSSFLFNGLEQYPTSIFAVDNFTGTATYSVQVNRSSGTQTCFLSGGLQIVYY